MKMNFKMLGLCMVASTVLAACSEPPEIAAKAAKRPDVAPYMGADNGFMTKGWTPGEQASWTEAINKRNQSQSEYSRAK
jgi:ABC-type glycerol-3-phosphate transport system substrate-binding protein